MTKEYQWFSTSLHVTIATAKSVWCDEKVMTHWVKTWKPNVKEEAILVLDVHKAQMRYANLAVKLCCCRTSCHPSSR